VLPGMYAPTWYLRVRANIFGTKCGRLNVLGNFWGTWGSSHGKLRKSVRLSSSDTKPSHLVYWTRTTAIYSSKVTFLVGVARLRCCWHEGEVPLSRNEGDIGPQCHTPNQTLTFIHWYQLLAPFWRRFQHHTHLTHHISERGRCRWEPQAQLYGVEAAVGWGHCGILQCYFRLFFLSSTKRHSTSNNCCYTSSFGHADRAISIISMRIWDETNWFGVACRTHRLLSNSLYSGGWRGPKAGWSNSVLLRNWPPRLIQTTKKHTMSTAVIHKDADHTRTFHCCHAAMVPWCMP